MIATLAAAGLGLPVAGAVLYRRARQRRAAAILGSDAPRAIAESGFVSLGGIEQWVAIRGDDRDNPILLIVHGGPGAPASIFTPRLRAWERHFTVVQWDQRGAGKTFGRNRRSGHGDMTSEQLVRDGLLLVEHLCARLGQERLVLLSSSAGTMLAVPMAQLRPERFSALVLTDLNVDMRAGEILGHRLALARLRAAGHRRGAAVLESIGAEPCYWDRAAWQRKQAWLMNCDPVAGALGRSLLWPSLIDSPLHSLRDLGDFAAGLEHSQASRFVELMGWDARYWGRRFEVPVFWFHGERDVLTPTALAEAWAAEIDAPEKDGALIPGVGHLCAFAAPERLLGELLSRVRPRLI